MNLLRPLVSKLSSVRSAATRIAHTREWALGLVLYVLLRPELANAGILSAGMCRPYRQLVDNELFVIAAAIAGVILVVAWKLGNSNTALSKGVGVLAALVIALNIENILQVTAGVGIAC